MSRENGKWEYDPDVLRFLCALYDDNPIEVGWLTEFGRDELGFQGIVLRLQNELGVLPEDAVDLIDKWIEWRAFSWEFPPCEHCGNSLLFHGDGREETRTRGDSYSCVCGASYTIDGWKKFHRDDSSEGSTTFQVVINGRTIDAGSLEEADKLCADAERAWHSPIKIANVRVGPGGYRGP